MKEVAKCLRTLQTIHLLSKSSNETRVIIDEGVEIITVLEAIQELSRNTDDHYTRYDVKSLDKYIFLYHKELSH